MTTLIALAPTSRGGAEVPPRADLAHRFEAACEYVDGLGSRKFSRPDLFAACGSAPAASQLINAYLALGFIERLSERGAKPVFYRVRSHALPKQVTA